MYRDIKPENILLDIDGHVRIADFGLSKIIPPLHKSYSFCGSPEYMSPEMLACVGHDKRLDIYCLGALLFEMLTGLPPFYSRDDTQGMYERIMNEEVQLPNDLHLADQPLISSLLTRLMQKDPSRRYQSLAEVKRHPWLQDVSWQALLERKVKPPIIPNVRESHIDPDYTELPLDFEEDSHQHRGRVSTLERRYSYYYESTLQSKKSLAGGPTGEQYSQFFANDSRIHHAASIQSDNSLGPPVEPVMTIENFTFIDVPREELEVLRTLKHKTQHQRPMVINPDQIQRRRERSVRAANQQDTNLAMVPQHEILIAEEDSNSRNQVIVSGAGPGIVQTASNGSIITFYDESNQSIA